MPTRTRSHPARRPLAATEDAAGSADRSALPLALSVVALAVAGVALGWSLFFSGAGAGDCQARAWDSVPTETDLPAGWSVETRNFFVGNLSMTMTGPPAADESGEGAIYATVTCYGSDGAEALDRSRAADIATGNPTGELTGIGEAGYTVGDEFDGLSAIHFRRGDLVAYLVIAGTVSTEELRSAAGALDNAIRTARAGRIPTAAPDDAEPPETSGPEPTLNASEDPFETSSPGASAVAPGLEALLPTSIDETPYFTDSASGADVLQDDPGSRAMSAALRALGKSPGDLQVAQAYDENDSLDLYFVAFRLPGAEPEAFRTLILQSWLVADAEGITIEDVELDGKSMSRVDYGDDLADAYLYSLDDVVIIMHTSSPELAETGAAALP